MSLADIIERIKRGPVGTAPPPPIAVPTPPPPKIAPKPSPKKTDKPTSKSSIPPKITPSPKPVPSLTPPKVIPKMSLPLPLGIKPTSKLGQVLTKTTRPPPDSLITERPRTHIEPTITPRQVAVPDQFRLENPELAFLLRYAEPKQVEVLSRSIVSRKPEILRSIEFQVAAKKAYESLTETEKVQYGLRFQPFKEAPVEEWKYHLGGLEYLKSLTVEQRDELISKTFGDVEGFKKRLTNEEILEIARRYAARGGVYGGQIDEKFLREYAWEQLIKTPMERRELYYSQLPAPARWYSAAFKATISTAAFPIILPQTIVKYATGKGTFTDVLGRIQTGKPLILPDVAMKIHKYTPPAPSGVIGIGISETIGWATGRKVGEWERAQKYPVESVFATVGEITGLLIGGKAFHVGRVSVARGLEKLRVPTFPMKYKPTMLIRKGYWKARVHFGKIKEVPPEFGFPPKALPSDLSYAPGRTISERIISLKKVFAETKVITPKGDEFFVGIHTTVKTWLKPIVRLSKGRESPGVSFAPLGKGAPRFLRITGRDISYETTGISLFPRIKLPTAPLLFFRKLKDIPRVLRTSYVKSSVLIKKEPGVYVAPKTYMGGAEYEVIARGWAKRLGIHYVTKIEGVVVPHPEFQLIEKIGAKSILTSIKESTKDFFTITSHYGIPPSIPIISPGYAVASLGYPSIPSVPSTPSIPSYPSIPSVPSTPSIPSYSSIPSVPSTPSIPSYPSIPSVPSIQYKIPKFIPPPSTTYELFGHTSSQGYNVKVRERHYVKGKKVKEGKFIRINKRPLDFRNAKSLMGMVLDSSAAASGKIVPVNAMAQNPLIDLKPFEGIEHKFYMKDNILIEKPKYRIDTKGEVKGISALGWYAEKTKKAIAKKKQVVAHRSRARQKPVGMFDMGMDDMLINIDKIFKGAFNGF